MTTKHRRGRNFGFSCLTLSPLSRCSHHPLKHMCQVSINFQTALSILRNPALWRERKLKLTSIHAVIQAPMGKHLFQISNKWFAVQRSLQNSMQGKINSIKHICLLRLSWKQPDGIVGWDPWTENRCGIFQQHIRDKGLATQPFEDHWHTRAFTSLGPLGGKPVEHFQYVILLPLEAWDCHA